MNFLKSKGTAWILLFVYLFGRFVFDRQLAHWNVYLPYYFEIALVVISFVIFRPFPSEFFNLGGWKSLSSMSLFLFAGGAMAYLLKLNQVFIPFDVNLSFTVFMLLLGGPLLEELVFRFSLWDAVSRVANSQLVAWAFTSLLFSYAHFHAFWQVPDSIKIFIVVQTAYTFALGMGSGYFKLKHNSVLLPLISHIIFNCGFYLVIR